MAAAETECIKPPHNFLYKFDVVDNNSSLFRNKIEMDDMFHREDERQKTFSRWPLDFIDKNVLAKTGMWYVGSEDKVKCYFCEVEIGRWERQDDPVDEHLRWSPNCPLLRRRTTNNITCDQEELDRLLPPQSYDTCGANEPVIYQQYALGESSTESPQSIQAGSSEGNATTSNGNVSANSFLAPVPTCTPEFPEYVLETARVASFEHWPKNMKQKPHNLAEAGFFYTNKGDRVICFSCGGGLKDWDDNDDPWEQHALWLSKCRYLNLNKGPNYVEEVKEKLRNASRATDEVTNNIYPLQSAIAVESAHVSSNINETTNQMAVSCSSLQSDTLSSSVNSTSSNDERNPSTSQGRPAYNTCSIIASNKPEEKLCKICKKSECNTVFLPCKHIAACAECAPSVDKCPTCDIKIELIKYTSEEKLCKICYAAEYNTAFLPCGHVVACAKCASSVTKCPLCRKEFTDVMRVYFS